MERGRPHPRPPRAVGAILRRGSIGGPPPLSLPLAGICRASKGAQ